MIVNIGKSAQNKIIENFQGTGRADCTICGMRYALRIGVVKKRVVITPKIKTGTIVRNAYCQSDDIVFMK
jgi:hypothetical protein